MKKRKTPKPISKPEATSKEDPGATKYEHNVERWAVCPDNNHIHKHLSVCYFVCTKFRRCKRMIDLYLKYGYPLPVAKEKKHGKHRRRKTRPQARDEGGVAVPEQAGKVSGH